MITSSCWVDMRLDGWSGCLPEVTGSNVAPVGIGFSVAGGTAGVAVAVIFLVAMSLSINKTS